MPGIEDIQGLGPAKTAKLRAAGITDLQDLASLDLRRPHELGIGNDVLRDAKRQARRLLDKEGIAYEKAPYGDDRSPAKKAKATKKSTKKTAKKTTRKASKPTKAAASSETSGSSKPSSRPTAPAAKPRRGLLARLLGRK